MLNEQTLDQMNSLGLKGMAAWAALQANAAAAHSLSTAEWVGLAVDAEAQDRAQRKRERMLKQAKLRQPDACLEGLDYTVSRGLDRSIIAGLSNCAWIHAYQHVVVSGHTGTGKSYVACALAQQAVRMGLSAVFKRFPRMLEEMEVARADGSLPKYRHQLARAKLLVLDDWAVAPITVRGRQDLLEVVEDRCDTGSLLITSQLPVDQWHDYLGDPSLADAILDRILHRAHRIDLRGESMRKLRSSLQEVSYENT